ncbi:hypothetical protein EV13_1525 [Prochlorococcus sp. MIT 0702]|nr:hypothetical protein EV13_1525 [Prochlorococcus sp. MIT 0702]KGG29309.1 hypothetical protein EV12_0233 [Prochlorococcus sp. MIT 0701]KGG31481.1 hypothetical protein EV14_2211 [Prochlorococcus sp. MIT 0703]
MLITHLNWIQNLNLDRWLYPFSFGINDLQELSTNLHDQHHDSCLLPTWLLFTCIE